MKKLLLLSLLVVMFLALSSVSAEDNLNETQTSNSIDKISDVQNTTPEKTPSQMQVSDNKGYTSFSTTLEVKLTSNNTALASKEIKITVNSKTYTRTTDSNGKASLALTLNKGTYNVQYFYAGDDNTLNTTATSKLTISDAVKTSLKVGDKNINYRQGSKCLFYVKLLDGNGKVVKNQKVTFKVSGKTYTATTNGYGNAKVYLNLKKGKRTIKYSFSKTAPYLSSSGSFKVSVKAKMAKGNGYWLWSQQMKSVNLKKLSAKGTKHILLHVHAIAQYGKSSVVSFIKKAHKYGIKVHIWMQICYSGGKWVSPVNKDNTFKYSFINKKIKEAKRYAKIKGVDGIHLDYIRFGGTAHNYKTSTDAINYLVKKISIGVHKIKSNMIVSAAVMPEPSMMIYYYGQDIPTMSKYLDSIMPMVYKENYGKSSKWVKYVTNTFVKQSNGAQLWTGLQTYQAHSAKKLPHSTLLKDARAAESGGAYGVMLFRIGLTCNFNFKKV